MKRSPRSVRTLAAATAGLVSILAGCSSPADPGGTGSPADGPVELTFASWMTNSQNVVDAFNSTHDDIRVTFEEVPYGEAYSQLLNRASAGTLPDVLSVEYQYVPEMATQGVLTDIKAQAGDLITDGYEQSVQDLVTFGDAVWGIPLDAGVVMLYYRADLFQELDIDVPTTWEEYEAAAREIVASHPDARIGPSIANFDALYATLAWQDGARWASVEGDSWKIDMDDAVSAKVAEYHQRLIDDGLVWTDDNEVLNQYQADGRLWSFISGAWYSAGIASTFPDQAGDWRVAALPTWDGKPSTGMLGGTAFGVSADSQQADAAVEFITWMTNSAEGIQARIEGASSSVFPLSDGAREAAANAFDTSFFGGQDVYAVALDGYRSIPAGWQWSPATTAMYASFADHNTAVRQGEFRIADLFPDAESATVQALEDRGITVIE